MSSFKTSFHAHVLFCLTFFVQLQWYKKGQQYEKCFSEDTEAFTAEIPSFPVLWLQRRTRREEITKNTAFRYVYNYILTEISHMVRLKLVIG